MSATGVSLEELPAQVHRLDDEAHEHKLTAVLAYRSQVPALEAEFGLLSRPAILRYEVLWPLP